MMNNLCLNRLALIASLDIHNLSISIIREIWIKYETGFQESIKNRGKRNTLELRKQCYVFLRNYLLELPTTPIPFTKTCKLGLPKPLWVLKPLITGCRQSQRLALTIVRGYEQIRLDIDYNKTESITDPVDVETQQQIDELEAKLYDFLHKMKATHAWYVGDLSDPIQPWSNVSTTLSKGPNGPAVATSHLDAKAVLNDTNLFNSLSTLNEALGQSWITKWCVKQAESFKGGSYHTGRLGFSSEAGGKTRIFAIGDYWSQLSLKVIQHSLYNVLRRFSTDATSDQDKGFKTLIEESCGHETFSFDLSNASDRIPAKLQRPRLRIMANDRIANSWLSVMTERVFHIKPLRRDIGWTIGQPLGLLSSYPSFTLWHHDIVQLVANWENYHNGKPLRFFKQYRILGDDIVIFNKKVAKRYQQVLTSIGLTINMSKSIIGGLGTSQLEFAKRLALRGKEMSPIKQNILSKDNKFYLLDLLEILVKTDFINPELTHFGLSLVLKSQDLQILKYIYWLRFSHTRELFLQFGDVGIWINRDEIMQSIKTKRFNNIIQKAAKHRPLDIVKAKLELEKLYESTGVCLNGDTLTDRSAGDLTESHPIVLALTQTSRELQFALFELMDEIDPNSVSPVEYLPVVSSKSYFISRNTNKVFLSKIIIESLSEVLISQNIKLKI